jgi:acyl-coenzyme A synthetase/AMP-(fatty) acid ligase
MQMSYREAADASHAVAAALVRDVSPAPRRRALAQPPDGAAAMLGVMRSGAVFVRSTPAIRSRHRLVRRSAKSRC